MDVDASAPPLTLSPPARPNSAPAAPVLSRPKQFSWNPTDAAHLRPARITITRLYQRAPKAPYHHLHSQPRLAQPTIPKSPGPRKKKPCMSLDAALNPLDPRDSFSDPSDTEHADPIVSRQDLRTSSAPPEDTNTPEAVSMPRISDDTAILHAFLSRAAASKRPMPAHRRESLENRRDSDAVRHALASTDKPEVLTDLDPASPLLPSNISSDVQDTEPEPESAKEEPVLELPTSTPTRSKAPRRTTRTRTPAAAPKKPAKIAIRSAADHIALKRTEAQELALLTRANTRKNKGKSVMPQARLLEVRDEILSFEDPTGDSAGMDVVEEVQSDKSVVRRGVQWNETLTHVREFESDSPDSPPKTKARTSRVSARALEPFVPLTSAEEPNDEAAETEVDITEPESQPAVQPPSEPTPRAKAVPIKRKSRIATPARSSKLAVAKPVPTAPLLQPPTIPAPQPSEPLTTSLGTPKKPPTPFTALKPPSLSSRLEFAPPKTDVASSTVAHTSSLPGLSSPAKKRVRTTLGKSAVRPATGQKDGELPGLTSPAKRKRAGVKFS
ncbi:hypothetical protein E4T50_14658 [Aureobasidium sp. EXF-12298]|nr:hypothetical protein E4T50_14658 [Aureobasidium sp. EXF-12298]KAI4752710.1 hypothetical protein E4T51_14135 [Aureobasidium sp. EXF-12344]KAI4769900.1 hypothetical protein E4T52_15066 [Aureobasidium sp. EXF-3400]